MSDDEVAAGFGGALQNVEGGHHGGGDALHGRIGGAGFEGVHGGVAPGHAEVGLNAFDHLANGERGLGGEQTGARGHEEAASGRHGSILHRRVTYTRLKIGQLSVPVLSANDSCSMPMVRRMLR